MRPRTLVELLNATRPAGMPAVSSLLAAELYGPVVLPAVNKFRQVTANGVLTDDHLADVKITRGRTSPAEDEAPTSITATIVGPLPVTVGNAVRVRLTPEATTAMFWPDYANVPSGQLYRGTGTVTDLGDVALMPPRRVVPRTPMTAAGLSSRLGNQKIGGPPFPAGVSSDVEIVRWALSQAVVHDFGLMIADWSDTLNTGDPATIRYGLGPEISLPMATRPRSAVMDVMPVVDVDAKTPQALIADLAHDVDAVLVERADGRFDWVSPEGRRQNALAVTIDASQLMAGATVRQAVGDVVNTVAATVSLPTGTGDERADTVVTVQDTQSAVDLGLGVLPGEVSLGYLANATDPAAVDVVRDRASDLVGRYGRPSWSAPSLTVDIAYLWARNEGNDRAVVRSLLTLELTQLVQLVGLPSTSPVPGGVFWVEGITENITRTTWTLTLAVAAYGLLSPGVRWSDLDATLAWSGVDAATSWLDTTRWDTGGYVPGAWRQFPTDLNYYDVPAATTWATITTP